MSKCDTNQMIKLSRDKKLNCPEPILIIIGGYKENWSINARLYVNSQEIIMNPKQYKMILLTGEHRPREVSEMLHSSKSCVSWTLDTRASHLKYGENNKVEFSEHPNKESMHFSCKVELCVL